MINPKMEKYANLKFSIEKEHGFEIERSYDNNYQIVVKSSCGDLVDFYSSTGSFSFRKERIRGKGFDDLLRELRRRDTTYFKDFKKPTSNPPYQRDPSPLDFSSNRDVFGKSIEKGFSEGGYVKSPKKIEVAGNVTKERSHKIAMVNVTDAHDSSEFQRLMRVLDETDYEKEGDSFMDSISKAMPKIREAKPKNFLERISMNYLRKRHYKIID